MALGSAGAVGVFMLVGRVLPDVVTIGVCAAALGAVFVMAFRRIRRRDREINERATQEHGGRQEPSVSSS